MSAPTLIVWLAISTISGIGLLVAYWTNAGTRAEGISLGAALLSLAIAAGHLGRGWQQSISEHRPATPSTGAARRAAAQAEADHPKLPARRTIMVFSAAAGTALVAGLLSPLRSLGPAPRHALRRTGWSRGRRLVTAEQVPLRMGDIPLDTVVTVFPEGETDNRGDSQVVVLHLPEDQLVLPEKGRLGAPSGHVAYSKVCTHAGCPVGLYDAESHELVCPCHQSVFLASEGARPTFGPAARALPQLPIGVDDDGYLVAMDDFDEPIGPSYWNRP